MERTTVFFLGSSNIITFQHIYIYGTVSHGGASSDSYWQSRSLKNGKKINKSSGVPIKDKEPNLAM